MLSLDNLPICKNLRSNLNKLGYKFLTKVQELCFPIIINGKNLILSSPTGSGKTLALLIPIIEKCHRMQWNLNDEIIGCIITPSRELSFQIFDISISLTKLSGIKISLIISKTNWKLNNNFTLIIGTPGCIFLVFKQELKIDYRSLFFLMCDEYDKILDLGFFKILFAIFKITSKKKQILFSSASFKIDFKIFHSFAFNFPINFLDLNKKKSSKKIKNISVPNCISQYYILIKLENKTNFLKFFLESHLKKKGIIFFSSKAHAKFYYEIFLKMRIKTKLILFISFKNQNKRFQTLINFDELDDGFLFTTELLSRGINFKNLDWVVQLPNLFNLNEYIHKTGRTGRLYQHGKSLLVVFEYQLDFINKILYSGIPITKLSTKIPEKEYSINRIKKIINEDSNIKTLSFKSFCEDVKELILNVNKIKKGIIISYMKNLAKNYGVEL